jgi:hypothetical protein
MDENAAKNNSPENDEDNESQVRILPRTPNTHGSNHRVDRVLGFFSSRRNWDLHPLFPGEEHTCVIGELGGPNPDEGTDTVVL